MSFFLFGRGIRHPFFPGVTAEAAATARGRSQALAGTFGELARAAARGAKAARAVYVLTSELSDGEREALWRLFEVPVYALQQRDGHAEAWECEAQNGMHIADSGDEVMCACGRPGAKIAMASPMGCAAD
ncbi:MAG TPA: hypothetical protein VHW09_01735 [Bryobacteraceae bacterium]|jgi:hypothetical protein|nr:hypothetical protein [Bryobacteraceae bacterium]